MFISVIRGNPKLLTSFQIAGKSRRLIGRPDDPNNGVSVAGKNSPRKMISSPADESTKLEVFGSMRDQPSHDRAASSWSPTSWTAPHSVSRKGLAAGIGGATGGYRLVEHIPITEPVPNGINIVVSC